MKKLVFLLALFASFAFVNTANAQYVTARVFSLQAGDTLNNTDSVVRFFQNTVGIASMGIQVNLNKISGTVAGKVYLYASNDNRNYTVVDSASYNAIPPSGTIFTGTATGYTHVAAINRSTSPFQYYAILAVSTGTVSAATQFLVTTREYYPY